MQAWFGGGRKWLYIKHFRINEQDLKLRMLHLKTTISQWGFLFWFSNKKDKNFEISNSIRLYYDSLCDSTFIKEFLLLSGIRPYIYVRRTSWNLSNFPRKPMNRRLKYLLSSFNRPRLSSITNMCQHYFQYLIIQLHKNGEKYWIILVHGLAFWLLF